MCEVQELREKALQARRLARTQTDEHARAVVEALAEELELLAVERENKSAG